VERRSLAVLKHLDHPNLLRTYETWQVHGFLVMAMELADRTLLDRWEEAHARGLQGIPHDELLPYLRDAADGIDFLQKRYIQHRDVKPQNLLLVGSRVKVGDFGLARLLANSITGHTGSLTVAYAAPEFFEGRTTRQSDQYSLAVTYCQLRGGKLPFIGTPAAMVAAHLHRRPDLTMLPAEERPIAAKALSKRPADRWPTCRAFVEALADPQRSRLPARRGRWKMWLALAACAAVVALVAVVLLPLLWKPPPTVAVRPFEMVENGPLIRSVAITPLGAPIGRLVALSNGSSAPVLWDVELGKPIRTLPYEGGACAALAPLQMPLGATGHDDASVILWDLTTGQKIREFMGHTSSVNSVAFSPDAGRILSGACDNTVRLWDRETGRQIHCLKGHEGFVTSVAFDSTGRRGISGSWDATVRLWDLDAGAEVRKLTGHTSKVQSVGFSPDGRYGVSCGDDRTIRVWDVESGEEVHRFTGESGRLDAVNFVEYNHILVADGPRVRLLDATTGRDLLTIPAQPSVVQSVGYTGMQGRHYVIIGTTENGVRVCQMP
jgi:Protein kinase domain/WD domain, G-beta repeat